MKSVGLCYTCVYIYRDLLYGSGSKSKVCNRAGAHTRDIPRYIVYANRQAPVATNPSLAVLSRATNRDKGYVTSPALHTFITEGC